MRVLVTGGTGFVGAHVARKLVERGDQVYVLHRPTSDTNLINKLPVTRVVGDITDHDSLLPHFEGMEQLYHVAADYRLWAPDPREIFRNNVDGTRNVLEAAKQTGVGRVVYTSTVGCLGIPDDGSPGTEDTPVTREELVGNYKKSKYDAQEIALDYARRGLDVVIVNPSTPVGPGDIKPTPTGKIIVDYMNGKIPAYVETGMNLVAVEDVAEGHLLAAEKGRTGEKYILGNRNMSLREMLETLARIAGRNAPNMKVPLWLAYIAAVIDTTASRVVGKEPGIPVESVLMARKWMYFSVKKAITELELPQSPVDDALERAVTWFEDNGYLRS